MLALDGIGWQGLTADERERLAEIGAGSMPAEVDALNNERDGVQRTLSRFSRLGRVLEQRFAPTTEQWGQIADRIERESPLASERSVPTAEDGPGAESAVEGGLDDFALERFQLWGAQISSRFAPESTLGRRVWDGICAALSADEAGPGESTAAQDAVLRRYERLGATVAQRF